jgi:transcriptional regulator with XRE-family HTH domain
MDDLAFGRLVKLARHRRGWRQEDLAARAAVSRTTVSRV